MSFSFPAKRRDRIAVAKLLAVSLPGFALIVFLTMQSALNIPAALMGGTFGEAASPLSQWGVDVMHLLLVMPAGAAIVLFVRLVVGVDAFGIFTPMLLALALIQMGPMFGLLLLGSAMIVGRLVAPTLDRLRQPRMAMMAVLIGLVVCLLYGFMRLVDEAFSSTAFPVVVTALVMERWWVSRTADGPAQAARLLLATAVLAILLQLALMAPVIKSIAANWPLALPVIGTLSSLALGTYRGLRLTELPRFAPILRGADERSGH